MRIRICNLLFCVMAVAWSFAQDARSVGSPGTVKRTASYFLVPAFTNLGNRSSTVDGLFTNTQMNLSLTSLVHGIDPATEFHVGFNGNNATEAFTAGIAFPKTSSVFQGNVVAAYANNASTRTNVVAGFFQTRAAAPQTHNWALNSIFMDGGFSGVTGASLEADCNIRTTSTGGACIQINGSFAGILDSFPALQIAAPLQGGKWAAGIVIGDGAAQGGLSLGSQTAAADSYSQTINLIGRDSSDAARLGYLQASPKGDILINPTSGQGIGVKTGSLPPRGAMEINIGGDFDPDPTPLAVTHGYSISDGENLGLVSGLSRSGAPRGWIQSRTFTSAGVPAALTLNELGGNVGIGKKDPGQALDVSGQGRFSAGLTQGTAGTLVTIHMHKRAAVPPIPGLTRKEATLTWSNAMPDTDYTVTCNVEDPATKDDRPGLILERIRTRNSAGVGVVVYNSTAKALAGVLHCSADHD